MQRIGLQQIFIQGRRRMGAGGSKRPSCLFLRGKWGQKCPSLTLFILILATVFQPENTIEGTLFKIDSNSPNHFAPLSIKSQYIAI